jgi:hypothetical protein
VIDIHTTTAIQDGYLKRRKKAAIIFYSSIYLLCALIILTKMDLVKIEYNLYIMIISSLILLFNVFSLIHLHMCKRTYNDIIVPHYNEINVFSKKKIIILILPILISATFMPLPTIGYILFIGTIYLTIERLNRPFDESEFKR